MGPPVNAAFRDEIRNYPRITDADFAEIIELKAFKQGTSCELVDSSAEVGFGPFA